jgi:hypothetical protein
VSDFYVGYLPKASAALAKRVKFITAGIAGCAIATAIVLALGQARLSFAAFEFGRERAFSGIIEERPVPSLLVKRPGHNSGYSRYLLVAAGKHGADELVKGMNGRNASLRGQMIYRESGQMIEVAAGSVQAGNSTAIDLPEQDLGVVTVTGELVDTKCYLGVMNPGFGKVHRDCASRCLSGGIPAALLSNGELYYLPAAEVSKALRRHAGELTTLQGKLVLRGGTKFLLDIHKTS